MATLGQIVRARRLELRLKQTTLADRAGMHQSEVSDIENGRRVNPTQDVLERLAGALGIPVAQLLAATETPPEVLQLPPDVPPTFARAFLAASRFLTARQQETVLRFVQSLAAEVEEAERDAQKARRELVEPLSEEARPVKQNGQHA